MTTADYLNQLQQDREDLVDNLETKGITGLTGDETFTELVPEVLNIETTPDTTDLRTVMNMSGANVSSETDFDDYPQALYNGYINALKDNNNLVNNMPQNTYTGTSVSITSINNLQPAKTIMTKESTQDGTPTTSNPIEIKTIKGYRNLTDTSVGNYEQGGINNNGNKTATASNIRSTFYSQVKSNTKYTICADEIIAFIRFHEYNNGKSFLQTTQFFVWSDKATFTTRSDTRYIIWSINYDNTDLTGKIDEVMKTLNLRLIEGEVKQPYEPYNKNFIYEKIVGKNKYNKIYTSWYRNNSTNFDNETLDSDVNYVRSNSFEIKSNETYTISGVPTDMEFAEIRTYNENREYLGSLNTSIFTLNSNVKYINLLIDTTNYSGVSRYKTIKNANIQIEEGTEVTTYEANKDYPTILLNDNEIVGINNNKDELIIDVSGNCYLNKKTKKIDVYGGETITTDYMSTTGSLTTGATVYYVLDTPELIDLKNRVDLSLYEGTNTITNSENADMEIKYIKGTYE